MTRYAIKVVPPEWEAPMPLPFDKTSHDYSKIEQGTRVLVFRRGEGIIGEGEVKGFFVQPSEWPPETKDTLSPAVAGADYLLPLGMLYSREKPITQDEVRQALDDHSFPPGDVWRPIDQSMYHMLTNWPS
jgi:hypothetical protein